MGKRVLVSAFRPGFGFELFAVEENGAFSPIDINRTAPGASSFPGAGALLDNTFYFAADDGQAGIELWRSDGTVAGTVRVADIDFGAEGSVPAGLTAALGTIFFSATDTDGGQNTGNELYKLVGGSPVLVRDIDPGVFNGAPNQFVEVNGKVVFSAIDITIGREPFVTDGTEGNTEPLKNIQAGPAGSQPLLEQDGVVGDTLFFAAADADGRELWKTDATEAGTVKVKDINVFGDSNPQQFQAFGNVVLFQANNGIDGIELWRSNGTAGGTFALTNVGGNLTPTEITVSTPIRRSSPELCPASAGNSG